MLTSHHLTTPLALQMVLSSPHPVSSLLGSLLRVYVLRKVSVLRCLLSLHPSYLLVILLEVILPNIYLIKL